METTLHRQLKERFAEGESDRQEVRHLGYRVDAVTADGWLVEVQTGPLTPLREKLRNLLTKHRVRVVKPVVESRRIVRRARPDGPDLSARLSPKRGAILDVFDDLVGLVAIFPHPGLCFDVLPVRIDEVRVPSRRRPGFKVVDRRILDAGEPTSLHRAADLWWLVPAPDSLPERFTTADLAALLQRPLDFAQRVAYCLRLSGAVETVGKAGNRLIYRRTPEPPAARRRERTSAGSETEARPMTKATQVAGSGAAAGPR